MILYCWKTLKQPSDLFHAMRRICETYTAYSMHEVNHSSEAWITDKMAVCEKVDLQSL